MSNVALIVSNANTHAVISGASVFVNGVGAGSTDNSGQISISFTGNTAELTVKASGFTTFSSTVSSDSLGLSINMQPATTPSTTAFDLTINPEDVANGMPLSFSNGGSPITTNYVKGGIRVDNLLIGTQVVTGSVAGYNSINATFDLSQATNGVILMSASSDAGKAAPTKFPGIQDPDTSNLLPAITTEDVPEFIAPNTNQGTYFTMTQARMYIGNLFIDELNALQFALQDNKIPIYGYASRFYDIKAQGKSLVQGQFTINFVSEGYLTTVMREYSTSLIQDDLPVDPVKQQQQNRLIALVNKLQNPDPAWTPAMLAAAKTEIHSLAASLGPDALRAANNNISLNKKNQLNSILGLPGGDYPNAIYEDVGFDIVVQYEGAGRVITRRIEDCSLISNESIMDHSGTPIMESYGFIGRRLR